MISVNLSAEIDGVGSISISIRYLSKLLATYKASQTFTIETISDSVSLNKFKIDDIARNEFINK